jgi:L-asparaginase II
MIATCKVAGWDPATYNELTHPLQVEIKQTLAYLAEEAATDIPAGVDGCGLPAFVLPLQKLALIYLKLTSPDLIDDPEIRAVVPQITHLMNAYPLQIAGTNFIDSVLLSDPNIIAKMGAKGVYAIGLRHERLGIALKISDGTDHVWANVVASILEQLGYANRVTISRLREQFSDDIPNDDGVAVGERRAVFTL